MHDVICGLLLHMLRSLCMWLFVMNSAKMTELIDTLFRVWTLGDPGNHLLLPRLSCGQCSQPYSQGDSSDVSCGYQFCISLFLIVGDRPYRCELCSVSFTQKNNLTRHMQIHGGRFRYKCSYDTCNFATRRYESFKQHMIQHGVMPYQCRLCDMSYFFTQVSSMITALPVQC